MTTVPTPPAASKVLVALDAAGWVVRIQGRGVGLDAFTGYGEPRSNGTRPEIEILAEVDSYGLAARHPDGRALVAFWTRRCGKTAAGKSYPWTLDALRGRAPHECAPRPLALVRQLVAYVLAPDLISAVAACEAAASKAKTTDQPTTTEPTTTEPTTLETAA